MKGRILKSEVYSGDGQNSKIYVVTKQNRYGCFTRTVKLHEEDQAKGYDNDLDGFKLAEYKCDLAALKEKIKILNQRCIGLKTGLNFITYDHQTQEIFDQYKSMKNYVEKEKEKYNKLENNFLNIVQKLQIDKENFRKYIQEKRQNEKEKEESISE